MPFKMSTTMMMLPYEYTSISSYNTDLDTDLK